MPFHSAASSHEMRSNNTVRLQKLIWESGGISRAQLARDSGLSRSTVTLVVNELAQSGLVQESHVAASSGGRPPIVLKWKDDAFHLIGIDVGSTHVTALVANLNGVVQQVKHVQIDVVNNPQETLATIGELISEFIASAKSAVLGIGIALPCPVSSQDQDVLNTVILPKWKGIRLRSVLTEQFGLPVFLGNDANLGALAELWWGKCRSHSDFAFVKLGTGVGAGIFANGVLIRGKQGLSGEIGHIALNPSGPKCRCGQYGCLEAWIGTEALERAAKLLIKPRSGESKSDSVSIYDLIAAYRAGDSEALNIVGRAINQLGHALAPMVLTLNPSKIVLWGPLTQLKSELIGPLKANLERLCTWQNLSKTEVIISQLGDEAMALGAFTLALDKVLQSPKLQMQQSSIAFSHCS